MKEPYRPTDLSSIMLNDGRVFNKSGLPDATQGKWHRHPITAAVIHQVNEI